jgi:hypothetical protein
MSQCCFEEILAQNERLEYINSVYVDIFMHMPQGAIIVNIEGKIKEVNLAAQDMRWDSNTLY